MHFAKSREFLGNSLAHDHWTQVAKIGDFHCNFSRQKFFLLAMATKMVAAWSIVTNYYFCCSIFLDTILQPTSTIEPAFENLYHVDE